MKWSETELKEAISLCKKGFNYNEIAIKNGYRTTKAIKVKLNKHGYYTNNNQSIDDIICKNCGIKFTSYKTENRKFCSSSCSVTFNNKLRGKTNKRKNIV